MMTMKIVLDTSVVIALLASDEEKEEIIHATLDDRMKDIAKAINISLIEV